MDASGKIPLPPSLKGKYELTRELAVGGMGIIWLARDLVNNREVVFKFIAPELIGDEETRIRFLNEAKLTAQLEHPHIVGLYAAGEEEGALYIIYEYLEGTNVKSILEKYGQYRLGQALDILIKVADGIACAHRHKILHRDIKPENILVSPLGDKVKIVDFGIAKSIEDSQKLTQTGFIIGTPEYLSPEQAVGHKATYASDQYALAVLAYEMLTARLPIEDQNTVDLFTKKIRGAWVPIRDRRPEIPQDLAKIIEKAMATDAAQRYLTVDDFVKALTDFTTKRSTAGMPRPRTAGATSATGGTAAGVRSQTGAKGGATQRVSTTTTPAVPSGRALETVKKLAGAAMGLLVVAAIGFAGWTAWQARGSGSALPRMYGTLSTVHQLDGVVLSWDYPAAGSAFVRLQPGGTEKPMTAERGRFVVTLAPAEAKPLTAVDLLMKDGGKVSTEVDGVPFVHVAVTGDTLSVTAPPGGGDAALAFWPAGKESAKKEAPLKSHGHGLAAEGIPIAAGEDMMLQVVAASGEPRQPLSFLQKVPSVESYVETLQEKLGKLESLASIAPPQQGQPPKVQTGEELSKLARKTFEQLKSDVPQDAIDLLKDPVSSPSVEMGRKVALFEAVQRLDVLRKMATRAGYTGKSAELDALLDLPWPVRVKLTTDKGLPGKRKPAETDQKKLLQQGFVLLNSAAVDPAQAKTFLLQVPCMTTGNGTYLKLTIAKRVTVYLVGPDALPEGVHTQGVTIDVELDAAVLPKGELAIEMETEPVLAVAQYPTEILPIAQSVKLTQVSSAGAPTPVALTIPQ